MGKKHASQYANFGWLRLNDIRSDAKEITPDYSFQSVPARQ